MRRVVISGIGGHLGRELAGALGALDVEVHGLTRQDPSHLRRGSDALHVHRLDGRTETLAALFEALRPDAVFHLAGLYREEHRSADVSALVESNIHCGIQLLEAMRTSGCCHIVTAGSYLQHRDSADYRAFNLYAATKQAFEDVLAYYADRFGLSAVRLTLGNIYGERDTNPRLITDIARAWSEGTPLTLRSPDVRIDPVHVDDVVAAFMRAASLLGTDAIPGGTLCRYSVTSGQDVTPVELVRLFERLGHRKMIVRRAPAHGAAVRPRPWRGPLVPGWMPRISIEEGVARILASRRCAAAAVGEAR